MIKPDWIAVDWGTTNLRVWAMGAGGEVLAKRTSGDGMQRLKPTGFEPALLALVDGWLTTDRIIEVICCGMVGARQGWVEAGYRSTPCNVVGPGKMAKPPTADPRIQVHILPGVKQAKPADVMRGEETQIAGFLAQNPDFCSVLCLPGTHSKWVGVSNGAITRFTTFMTGELFSLLSKHSVLRHALASDGWDAAAFEKALTQALNAPATIGAGLFSLRAASLISQLGPASVRAQLSGLLIGQEVAAMRAVWQGQTLAILGADALAKHYATALGLMGVCAVCHDIEPLTLAGCAIAYARLEGTK